ncbi:uncharacterized protein LOC114760013 [Neltuma alba]|uniref:uncharacterized protein LOC114760013 n=1 Tax=Neltuma alba TaxID=207710 RepID=UPI0010A55530|nr:uncharacterized protein LOC114760013 [Prosopis alba]
MENVARCAQMLSVPYRSDRMCVHTAKRAINVDLGKGEYSCVAWQMSGIPCLYAYVAIKALNCNVYDFIEECYKIMSQQKIYSRTMILVVTIDMPNPNDYQLQDIASQVFLAPPLISRRPGRPRTNKQASQFQNKKVYHCSAC